MHSLRAQVLTLVVAAVLVTLILLAYFGTRTAGVQFRAIVSASRDVSPAGLSAALDSALVAGGIGAIRARVEGDTSHGGETNDSLRVLIIDPAGDVLASADSALRGRRGQRLPGGRFRIELGDARNLEKLEVAGGVPLHNRTGDTAAMIFRLPSDEHAVVVPLDVEGAAARFSSRLNRAIWLGIPALLAVATLLALVVTGRLLDPIRRLTTAAQGIADGRYSTRVGATGVSELGELAVAFDRMAESLERSESARRQVMRDVAHELRTPLTNLKAQIEALQDGLRPPDETALASLHEEATVLERLVGDVDVLARADAGRLDVQLAPLPIATVVASVIDGFVHAGRIARSRVEADVPEGARVIADRQRLGQVLRNLVDNAIRHGGADVAVAIHVTLPGDTVCIAVSDTGAGIPLEHQLRVFDRLYRVDASRARATGGSGLGLSIVKALVEAQHGHVRLTSAPGQGTTVAIDLPRAP